MTPELVMDIGRQAVEMTLLLAGPLLLAALVIGLIISIFQAATQILKNSVLHRKGAKIAKVRKENQSATRTAPVFHRHPQGEWSSTTHLLFPLRSLRLRAFAVRFSG
jgi:hypothetical protein